MDLKAPMVVFSSLPGPPSPGISTQCWFCNDFFYCFTGVIKISQILIFNWRFFFFFAKIEPEIFVNTQARKIFLPLTQEYLNSIWIWFWISLYFINILFFVSQYLKNWYTNYKFILWFLFYNYFFNYNTLYYRTAMYFYLLLPQLHK